MNKHKTARGREFNMQAFASGQGEVIAVGNSGRNARGDLLGPGGKILAGHREIANAAQDFSPKAKTKQVKFNPMEQEVHRKEVIGADGRSRTEITYADGSVEIIDQVDIDIEPNRGDL
jgi:hypothetical protein